MTAVRRDTELTVPARSRRTNRSRKAIGRRQTNTAHDWRQRPTPRRWTFPSTSGLAARLTPLESVWWPYHNGSGSDEFGCVQMIKPDQDRLDRVVAEARRNREQREQQYRERALKIYPWICGRCAREFTRQNLRELTVHHRDHNHDNNPSDGSNWELLCLYCHDNEHSRSLDSVGRSLASEAIPPATYQPFADLESLLKGRT